MLLQNGAGVDETGESDFTPLVCAIMSCRQEYDIVRVVQLLIKHGADVNKFGGNSIPVCRACRNGLLDVADMLLESGADPTLDSAIYLCDFDIDEWGYKDVLTSPLLELCSQHGNPGAEHVVEKLLERGVHVNGVGCSGLNELHRACRNGAIGIMRLLLKHGANPDEPD